MNLWSKMFTVLRAGLTDAGESLAETQALRILDQEIREAATQLQQSKDSLARVLAQTKLSEQTCTALEQDVQKYEGYAVAAIEKQDLALARDIAEKIANLKSELATEQSTLAQMQANTAQLQASITTADKHLKLIKQQADTIKATECVQKAQALLVAKQGAGNSKLRDAKDSLAQIKAKQAHRDAELAAAAELAAQDSDQDLEQRLENAGIIKHQESADDILARLKNQR